MIATVIKIVIDIVQVKKEVEVFTVGQVFRNGASMDPNVQKVVFASSFSFCNCNTNCMQDK